MIILDTDVLSIIQRGESREFEVLADRLDSAEDDVAVTIISFEEQMRGWLAFIARAQSSAQQIRSYSKLHALVEDFAARPILDFGEGCSVELNRLIRARIRIGTMDLKIPATALFHNATLISRNLVDFRKVPGLRVENWSL